MIDIEGPLSYFSTFAKRGSSHRLNGAAGQKFDMYGLAISLDYPGGGGL
jgi:hypothetical protein